jgi:hypothetical protein
MLSGNFLAVFTGNNGSPFRFFNKIQRRFEIRNHMITPRGGAKNIGTLGAIP